MNDPNPCFKKFLQVAVFAGGVDTTATETKGTVLIHSAEQVCFSFLLCGIFFFQPYAVNVIV